MKTSDAGVLEICEHEGIVLGPYLDSVGIWTYGVGHTSAAGGLKPEFLERADTRQWTSTQVRAEIVNTILPQFTADLAKYEDRVNQAVDVPVKQHEFDALVSFDFNTGGIFRARLTDHLNAGSRIAAANAFMGWLKPPEIRGRRKAEMELFRTGDYSANGDTIGLYDAIGNGRVKYRGKISGAALRELMRDAQSDRTVPAHWITGFSDWFRSVISRRF